MSLDISFPRSLGLSDSESELEELELLPPGNAKCYQNIANPTLHALNRLEMRGKGDESDGFNTGNTLQCAPSTASGTPPPTPRYFTDYGESPVRKWRKELMKEGIRAYVHGAEIDCSAEKILQHCAANATIGAHLEWLIEQRTSAIGDEMESAFQTVLDKLDNLTRKVDKMALEEVALRKAHRQSTAETVALKATVDTLTKQLDEHIVFPALPLADPVTSPSAMEEMTMQLSHVQHDIQDVLEAVRNPPGKRKR
jgi:hypothetical protein